MRLRVAGLQSDWPREHATGEIAEPFGILSLVADFSAASRPPPR